MPKFLPSVRNLLKGQSYFDLLLGIALLSIFGLALFRISSLSYEIISYSRARIAAKYIAQEKIEVIRNLPYDDVGTLGGIPPGNLAQGENLQRNGINYMVRTIIIYIDDPFDTIAPTDTDPADYKRVKVEVTWGGIAASSRNPVAISTDISSGIATEIEGGVLKVLVFDANGNPLPQASVNIVSSGITPAIDVTYETDEDGEVTLPGATECVACYRITVTKTDYSLERTYSISEITNPLKQDQGVFADQVTQISFAIDKTSTLSVSSVTGREQNYSPAPDVSFKLRGSKILGTDAYAQPIYKLDDPFTTNASGQVTIQDLEWDVYQIYMDTGTSYDIGGATPLLPLNIVPDSTNVLTFVVYAHSTHSLLTFVKDPTLSLIENVYVKVYDGVSFDQTKTTGGSSAPDFGQTLFSGLEEKTYQVEATASGFLNYTGEVIVTEYTKDEIVLTPE
ncbi:hypothetical protein A2V56_04405 [Candidatus Woesebacteria bacterium RBG_19FT_COMBO_42_9]|uniref:Uncharacterized protein n=1 Tax=Candidatus Woesebacteria bacterium RBG_16_42_24 TaxID=1802485 RepID=A0A1F7XLV3_9BACT|nr:MAG: hypothetical protein A2V97_04390 [Candidatus Woesebacteria bacterium RBG_16_42_24]OGM16208.1 MAG: hypothetical protein A2V56_04405 [Candidatus Woesebacteria bacterium RBG_19FT_COMBO_42_9]OGM68510.1 MAG: hypothetical protein A2985_04040 [Candidatus Woesebacteria bacterium RIFCSPLOWO2_01_FULL_43_11]